jgi:hypothetical protein
MMGEKKEKKTKQNKSIRWKIKGNDAIGAW